MKSGGNPMPINPYKPGAGHMPMYLAGRDAVIKDAQNVIDTLLSNSCARFKIYYGLRGVGKTVLLNCIEDKANENDIISVYFECAEDKNFGTHLINAIYSIINMLSIEEYLKEKVAHFKNILSAFVITWSSNPMTNENNLSLELNPENISVRKSSTLIDLLLLIGKIAREKNKPICILVDEIQYMNADDLSALLEALHRIAQKDLPIGFFGAGLPKILRVAGDSKSYAERLFSYVHIDTLKFVDAKEALIKPAEKLGVFYDENAIQTVFEITEGYPYFIQEYGNQVWEKQNANKVITKTAVEECYDSFIEQLDEGFFKNRLDRATPMEKKFMCKMVCCGSLPCNISDVSKHMGKPVKSISPMRGQLIGKGFIYDTSHGMIDFTVPQFDKYLKRVYPDL